MLFDLKKTKQNEINNDELNRKTELKVAQIKMVKRPVMHIE